MKIVLSASILALSLALVSCGGSSGGGSGDANTATSITSQFIDAPVKGLNIVKASGDGQTQDQGVFSCIQGEAVNFYLRDLYLGGAPCGEKIFVTDIAEDDDAAIGIGAVLQSLSSTAITGEDGLIDLSAIPATAAVATHITNLKSPSILTSIDQVISQATAQLQPKPVDLNAVRTHIQNSVSRHSPAQQGLKDFLGNDETKTIPVKATYANGCTTLGDKNCFCFETITADLQLSKVGENGVAAQLQNIIGCDPSTSGETDCDEDAEKSNKKIITSTSFSLLSVKNFRFSIENGIIKWSVLPNREGHLCYGDDGEENFVEDCYFENGKYYRANTGDIKEELQGVRPLEAANQFPFNFAESLNTTINLTGTSSAPVVSGLVTENMFEFHVNNYTSASNYNLVRESQTCTYTLENQ